MDGLGPCIKRCLWSLVFLNLVTVCMNSLCTRVKYTVNVYNFNVAADMIEKEMRKLFSISDDKDTRLWNRYMSNTFEPLNKPDSTIQDAGLYQGQVRT